MISKGKKENTDELRERILELEEENKEMKEVIRKLKENHAAHVLQLKDTIKQNEKGYEKEMRDLKNKYLEWTVMYTGYNEALNEFNDKIKAKDIELNKIMNKILIK